MAYRLEDLQEEGNNFIAGSYFTIYTDMENEDGLIEFCSNNNLLVMEVHEKFFEATVYYDVIAEDYPI